MSGNSEFDYHADLTTALEALRISDERLAETTEALRKADERAIAGRLALEVMHEVRNPLEALGHLIYLARHESGDSEKVREHMLQAEEQVAILGHIAKQTLGFARQSEQPRSADLVSLAEAAIRIHQRVIEEKRIHLVKDLPGVVVAEFHTGEILQVVSNLIVNALDALPTEGVLHLRIRKRQRAVDLVIADNGHGISPKHDGVIFQPFFTTKQDKGTGLGLALSKRIIERHNGTIRVRISVRPVKSGTAFKVSLPLPSSTA